MRAAAAAENRAGEILENMDVPYCIGWYHGHAIRIFEDRAGDNEKPWKVVFDPVLTIHDQPVAIAEERERSLEGAQNTVLALSQNVYLKHLWPIQDAIEWRLIRDA